MKRSLHSHEMSFIEIFIGYILSAIALGVFTVLGSKYGWIDSNQTQTLCYLTFIPGINSLVIALGMMLLIVLAVIYGFGGLGSFFAEQLIK